jgi:hypothetical protein
MADRATSLDYARMYVEVMTWARNAEDEEDGASLLETADYFFKLSVTVDQEEPIIRAGPLKELSFRDMHALADMFEGWAQDRRVSAADQGRWFELADNMRDLAEVAGPGWAPPLGDNDGPVGLFAFLAQQMWSREAD